tara:strand:+ start:285 stop:683 length:399 start_codon:yes stop_codon:yes gene_type:complete
MNLKFDSKARLQHLGSIRHAKSAAARDVGDRAIEIRDRLQRAESRKRQLEREFHPRDVKDALKEVDAEIETLEAELTNAEARRAEAGEAFQAAARTHENARSYAAEHGLPMPAEDAAEVRGINWPHAGTGGV